MRYTLLIAFLISYSGTILIAQTTGDNPKPKIRMVKEVLYKAENGELKDRKELFSSNIDVYRIFDKNEKMIENGRYDKDGSLLQKNFYERDENGDTIKGMTKKSSNEIKSQWTYEYDGNNNMTNVKTYDGNNKLTQIQSNKYDEKGNTIEMIVNNIQRNTVRKFIYAYNDNGEKIEQFRYNPDGNLKDRRTYSYDKDGNENIQFKFNPDGSFTKFVSEYDEMNNLTVQNWFNEQGEQTHQTSFEYVYDKNGNWISKRRSSNGELGMVWERQIDYYE